MAVTNREKRRLNRPHKKFGRQAAFRHKTQSALMKLLVTDVPQERGR